MRNRRTNIEAEVAKHLLDYFATHLGIEAAIDETTVDRPDIVIETHSGERIGIEITRLTYERFMKWRSSGTSPGKFREASLVVNLQKQMTPIIKKKNKKYFDYKAGKKLNAVWLCLHNDLYEFVTERGGAQLCREDFVRDAWFWAQRANCKFRKILFFSEGSKEVLEIYDRSNKAFQANQYARLPVMKFIEATMIARDQDIIFDTTSPEKREDNEHFD